MTSIPIIVARKKVERPRFKLAWRFADSGKAHVYKFSYRSAYILGTLSLLALIVISALCMDLLYDSLTHTRSVSVVMPVDDGRGDAGDVQVRQLRAIFAALQSNTETIIENRREIHRLLHDAQSEYVESRSIETSFASLHYVRSMNDVIGPAMAYRYLIRRFFMNLNVLLSSEEFFDFYAEHLHGVPNRRPLLAEKQKINSGFGPRMRPGTNGHEGGQPEFHRGVDLRAGSGEAVVATARGVVRSLSFKDRGYGYYIIVRHPMGYKTLYAHLSEIKVQVGQHVRGGQLLGYSGNTGNSTGPHLHYEILREGRPEDPQSYFGP